MPTLAIFLHQLAATGVSRNAVAIARRAREAGWRAVLITVRPRGDLATLADGLDHVVLGGPRLPRKLELALAVRRLRRELAVLSPDVVMSAGNHAHPAVLSAMKGNHGAATVYRISNDLAHGTAGSGLLAALIPRRRIAQRVVRTATRLILVSPHLAADSILAPELASGKARVIPNGVDVALLRRRADEPCDHPWAAQRVPVVLAVGRLARQKNFGTLVEAFALARASREMRLMILGGGSRCERRRLERQAVRLGVSADIAFAGPVENPFPYFRMATVLALPSAWEGSPNVVLEALACGVPVVASRRAGNAADILDGGRFGVLFDPADAAALAAALLRQADPAHRIPPADRAWDYDRSDMLASYQAVFEEMVDRSEAEPGGAIRRQPSGR